MDFICYLNLTSFQIRRIAFAEDGSYFVTVGNRHVKFWYLISASSVFCFCFPELK
jgi:hypothetical protein